MKVQIYKPTKTATQSGNRSDHWLLTSIIEKNHKSIDNVMGWTSSNNTLSQIKLKFNDLQSAVDYATNQGWNYQVIMPQIAKINKKSYADNFS